LQCGGCHEGFPLVLVVVDQVVAVVTEPGEVLKAVVGPVFVEVVDGERG
jgi:hypothetical protein